MKNKKVRAILIKTLLAFLAVFALMVVVGLIVPVGNDEVLDNSIDYSKLDLLSFDEANNELDYVEIKAEDYEASAAPYNPEDGEPKSAYNKKAYKWEEDGQSISFEVTVETAGEYQIAVDYLSLQTTVTDISLNVKVNGKGSDKLSNMELTSAWTDSSKEPVYDIYRNQVSAVQETRNLWRTAYLYDQRYYGATPVEFHLENGTSTITIEKNAGSLYIGSIYIVEKRELESYKAVSGDTSATANELITIEAEQPVFKSTAEIRTVSVQNTNVTPYSTERNMLNVISGDSFNKSGYAITYAFDVKTAGYYNISMKYYISQTNTSVYSKILVDNEVLYNELNQYEFKDRTGYNNETLNNGNDNILFYFEPGVHTLTLQLDASKQSEIYFKMSEIIEEINDLYLDIVKLTGGNTDKNKQWNVSQYIPNIESTLNEWIEELDDLRTLTNNISKSDATKQNRLYQNITNAYDKLVDLAKKPNEIPHKLNVLTEGSSSISNMLSNSLHTSTYSPLFLDKIYIHGVDAKLPKAGTNFFMNFFGTVQRVFKSGVDKTDEEVVEIWVNRSTYYVSLMQQYADAYFTPETGIKVRLSLLPDESKLTYANASGTNPDAALGVSQTVPYDLGLRGALVDLRTMPGFNKVIKDFVPGAYTGMIACDSVYGLPETQDFNVMFYRNDIIGTHDNAVINTEVPQTYDELIGILPAMQRMGMNFTMPLAGGSGLKGISVTAPFIYQYGGDIYSEDYLSTAIDSPEAIAAINMMVELFSLYSLPLTAQSFYDSFRNTTLPMGQAGFDTYLQLLTAAPEITGKWDIALPLGTKQADGTIDRTNCVTVKAVCIFEQSEKHSEAWDFIKWWLSEETQVRFANGIVATYGETFMWNTANVEAFKSLPLDKKHIETIVASWEDLYNIPQTPATYIVERGISDAWNAAVFDGVSVRAAISDAVIDINKEIDRKMSEFGFIDSKGTPLTPYFVPTTEEIKKWMED
jgi:ABC-type glycerol-3-phosphate transport system substrate-binding protein